MTSALSTDKGDQWSKGGVFKVPVNGFNGQSTNEVDHLYYYARSGLLCIMDKLYVPYMPDCTSVIRRFVLSWHCSLQTKGIRICVEPWTETYPYKATICIHTCEGEELDSVTYFKQNHLIDTTTDKPVLLSKHGLWARLILNKDRLMPRIIRIQRWTRSVLVRKKRLDHLALLALDNIMLDMDVIWSIAQHLL